MSAPLRIVFMGTPEFAVASLDILIKHKYDIAAIVTAPDRPSGRGLELNMSDVKKYALNKGLMILQPEKLKDEVFLQKLHDLKADLQVVVAFRMLPEVVWNLPRLGTINLHGSLLPQYRGAAPINRAIMNGEAKTGVSTFFLQQQVDTGKIIFRKSTPVGPNETAGEVHDRLMQIGATLILKTIQSIESGIYPQIDQLELIAKDEVLKEAPKIFREDCRIQWTNEGLQIHNFIRGLSPYPAALTELISPEGKEYAFKIYRSTFEEGPNTNAPGLIFTDNAKQMRVSVNGGYIHAKEVQLSGKKRMGVDEFLRGFPMNGNWRMKT